MVDHVSASWAIDETISPTQEGTMDITVSNTIISEALHDSVHSEGPHSKGMLATNVERLSVVNTLFAHNDRRHPLFHSYDQGGGSMVLANTVIYNWGGGASRFKTGDISVVGNIYKRGSDSSKSKPIEIVGVSRAFIEDNMEDGVIPSDPWDLVSGGSGSRVGTPPVWPGGFDAKPVTEVEDYVLANAGARPADRDAVDARIVNDVRSGTGRIIDSQDEAGGWPVLEENHRTLTLPNNPNGDDDSDGYTNLEEWLHEFAAEVEGLQQPDYHRADINKNGCVELPELMDFIGRWKVSVSDVSMRELMEAIGLWKQGC